MELVLEAESVVGRRAPVESKTTSLFPPGLRERRVFEPEPTPEPVILISKALYPPPATVLSTRSMIWPDETCPLPALAVKTWWMRVPEVMLESLTEKTSPVATEELMAKVPSFCW